VEIWSNGFKGLYPLLNFEPFTSDYV